MLQTILLNLYFSELERLQEEQFVHEKGSSTSHMFEMEHMEQEKFVS
jgi:hypothetical protein